MVKGIETNGKKIKKKDDKWLSEDLNEIRKIAENYIESSRPDDTKKSEGFVLKSVKKSNSFIKMVITIIGIIGILMLIYGIYSLTIEINVLSIVNTFMGVVFLTSFILFEIYG